ncbi:MAG: hypothetical protein WDO19_25095 [Bacteroidota bacterium]
MSHICNLKNENHFIEVKAKKLTEAPAVQYYLRIFMSIIMRPPVE